MPAETPWTVVLEDNGLTLRRPSNAARDVSSAQETYLNYFWLRDNCPSSWDFDLGDRTFDISDCPSDLRAHAATIAEGVLEVVWHHDGFCSRYDLESLVKWAANPGRKDAACLPRHYWKSEHAKSLKHFDLATLHDDADARTAYLRALLVDGIALVNGVPDSDDGVKSVAELAGHVRATFSGYFFDVKAYPKPIGTAYSAKALEPHTDVPCEEFPPGIQYLHCRTNTTTGGVTTFVDGGAVAQDLKVSNPSDFEILSSLDIPFRFDHDAFDMRARQRVIVTNANGDVEGVSISLHMSDIFDLDQRLLDRFYPAFHRFCQALRNPDYGFGLTLQAGQCVVFDNQRIVHGRTSFDPTSGTRILRGCYTDRGELRSRYRATERTQRLSPAIFQPKTEGAGV